MRGVRGTVIKEMTSEPPREDKYVHQAQGGERGVPVEFCPPCVGRGCNRDCDSGIADPLGQLGGRRDRIIESGAVEAVGLEDKPALRLATLFLAWTARLGRTSSVKLS